MRVDQGTDRSPRGSTAKAIPHLLADGAFRILSWRRQQRILLGDPFALDPRIDHHGQTLAFHHTYVQARDSDTRAWLTSRGYATEAAKCLPLDRCQLAISQFHGFLESGDDALRAGFLDSVGALVAAGRRAVIDGRDCHVVPNCDHVDGYGLHATPWLNAMVQAWLGTLCIRAHQLVGDERYLETAILALGPLHVPVERGGVRDVLGDGHVFYEKYAFPGRTRHVLNGFMSALMGVWDVARATGDPGAHRLFADGAASLCDPVLAAYDIGYTSLYDQSADRRATPACAFYTWVHARQLIVLSRITGRRSLAEWAERWRGYTVDRRARLRTSLDCWRYRAHRVPAYLRRLGWRRSGTPGARFSRGPGGTGSAC